MKKRGRKKKIIKKELVAEDWCFVCKDGGSLRICDYKDCLKSYHPHCIEKDQSILESDDNWCCNWHFCYLCNKSPKIHCFCCPSAVCSRCFCDADFLLLKSNRGLCNFCIDLALVIEEKKDVDCNGVKLNFNDRNTAEGLFYEYWEIVKEKEGLTSAHIISTYNELKKGKVYSCDSDSYEHNEVEEENSEFEDESELVAFDVNDTKGHKLGKRKRSEGKHSDSKTKLSSKKKEFAGWGSKLLLEFLDSIGKDTTCESSQNEVASIISEYIKDNKLFDPEKRRKVICDERLQKLLGRKSVNKNSIYSLLTGHLAENLDHSGDEFECSPENVNRDELVGGKRQQQPRSVQKSHRKKVVMGIKKSCFASIVPKNIKLMYLRRSLVEQLSKQLEIFDAKIMGSFVRVKSDPNDYLQKNSHMLVQVTGIKRTSSENSNTLLQVSNMVKEVPICKLSDDDFSEEECEDLCQRIKNGMLNRLTVVELEQKARSLHEDITKHWIAKELILLQYRIDRANEKGWRRELSEYMDSLLLLKTPSEQARLLCEVPEVIAEIVEIKSDHEDSMKTDDEYDDDSPEGDGILSCQKSQTDTAGDQDTGDKKRSSGAIAFCSLSKDDQSGKASYNGSAQSDTKVKRKRGRPRTVNKHDRVGSHNEATQESVQPARVQPPTGGEAPRARNKENQSQSSINDTSQKTGIKPEPPIQYYAKFYKRKYGASRDRKERTCPMESIAPCQSSKVSRLHMHHQGIAERDRGHAGVGNNKAEDVLGSSCNDTNKRIDIDGTNELELSNNKTEDMFNNTNKCIDVDGTNELVELSNKKTEDMFSSSYNNTNKCVDVDGTNELELSNNKSEGVFDSSCNDINKCGDVDGTNELVELSNNKSEDMFSPPCNDSNKCIHVDGTNELELSNKNEDVFGSSCKEPNKCIDVDGRNVFELSNNKSEDVLGSSCNDRSKCVDVDGRNELELSDNKSEGVFGCNETNKCIDVDGTKELELGNNKTEDVFVYSCNDTNKCVDVDGRKELELVVKDMKEVTQVVKDMREGFKQLLS